MCQAELRQEGHAVDFLHPRRHVAAPSRRRKWIMAGSAAAFLLLAYLVYARVERYLLTSEVTQLTEQAAELDASIPAAKKTRETAAVIGKWADDETIWLDQLLALSEGFPPAQDAILNELTFAVLQNGGQMDLKGLVREEGIIGKMEKRVRTRSGQIVSKSSHEDSSVKGYPWRFEATVQLGRRPKP
jgi:hypothetical protein